MLCVRHFSLTVGSFIITAGGYQNVHAGPGFTAEMGLGVSLTSVKSDQTSLGLTPLSVGVGGFVTERTALMLRVTHSTFARDEVNAVPRAEQGDTRSIPSLSLVNGFYGAVVQHHRAQVVFGFGAGITLIANAPFRSEDSLSVTTSRGVGLSARIGYGLHKSTQHELRIGAEVQPSFYKFSMVTNVAVLLEWQYR